MSILLENVTKRFGGQIAVDCVDLAIDDQEFFVFLGPSGCGKTTLLRLIAGLEMPDSGRISLNGDPVFQTDRNVPPEERGVGVVFQSYALWPHMSVEQNVSFPVETHLKGAALQKHVSDCLVSVELLDLAKRKPASLSGGQRQRVALARCLSQRARTILMDEPLANLDPHLRHAMEEELLNFHQQTRATTLYITHDQREAMALADRIAVMWQGQLLQVAAPEKVYREPSSEQVASFVGRSAILGGMLTASDDGSARVALDAGLLMEARCQPETQTGKARVVVRPEDVQIEDTPTSVPGARRKHHLSR